MKKTGIRHCLRRIWSVNDTYYIQCQNIRSKDKRICDTCRDMIDMDMSPRKSQRYYPSKINLHYVIDMLK